MASSCWVMARDPSHRRRGFLHRFLEQSQGWSSVVFPLSPIIPVDVQGSISPKNRWTSQMPSSPQTEKNPPYPSSIIHPMQPGIRELHPGHISGPPLPRSTQVFWALVAGPESALANHHPLCPFEFRGLGEEPSSSVGWAGTWGAGRWPGRRMSRCTFFFWMNETLLVHSGKLYNMAIENCILTIDLQRWWFSIAM